MLLPICSWAWGSGEDPGSAQAGHPPARTGGQAMGTMQSTTWNSASSPRLLLLGVTR